jgi:excisionase family DNA binding protein
LSNARAEVTGRRIRSEREAAELLGVSQATLRRMRKRGEIAFVRLSPHRLGITDQQIDELIAKRTVRAAS